MHTSGDGLNGTLRHAIALSANIWSKGITYARRLLVLLRDKGKEKQKVLRCLHSSAKADRRERKSEFEKSNLMDEEFFHLNLLRAILPRRSQPNPETLQKVTERFATRRSKKFPLPYSKRSNDEVITKCWRSALCPPSRPIGRTLSAEQILNRTYHKNQVFNTTQGGIRQNKIEVHHRIQKLLPARAEVYWKCCEKVYRISKAGIAFCRPFRLLLQRRQSYSTVTSLVTNDINLH